jgi:hypothetical protein
VNNLEILLLFIISIVVIIVFISIIDRRTIGEIGEDKVAGILQRLPPEDYIVFNDITIKNRSGTSQIDHLVISSFGIFVIETKCYKGWLFGSEESEKWTQALYTEKYQFYNPIQQNRGHLKALKYNLSKFPEIPFYPIVVLAGPCEFKTFDQVTTPVIYPNYLRKLIISLSTQKFLTGSQIAEIREIIQNGLIAGEGHKELHIKNAMEKAMIAENEIKRGTCPRCDGVLVEREGKYGRFFGCSNYPKCKFKKRL